eukprot:g49196.t1
MRWYRNFRFSFHKNSLFHIWNVLFVLVVYRRPLRLKGVDTVDYVNPQTSHFVDQHEFQGPSATGNSSHQCSMPFALTSPAAHVLVLEIQCGKNEWNKSFVDGLNEALDKVEEKVKKADKQEPRVVVLTGQGKFFSNGLDLRWLSQSPKESRAEFFPSIFAVLGRIMTSPLLTVAAVNGHAFGAGLFLALACDHRVQNERKGFLCFPELKLGLPLGPQFSAIAKSKLSSPTLRTAVLTAKRYTAGEALAAGIVDAVAPPDSLVQQAAQLGLDLRSEEVRPEAVVALKKELWTDALAVLQQPWPRNSKL